MPAEIRTIGRDQALDAADIRVALRRARDRRVDAAYGFIAGVRRAGVAVVARYGREDAAELGIAGVSCAGVAVVANDLGVGASNLRIAGINGAGVVVVAIDWTVDAMPGVWIAGVHGAGVIVVAIFRGVDAADAWIAGIDGAEVVVIAGLDRHPAGTGGGAGCLLALVLRGGTIGGGIADAPTTAFGIQRTAASGRAIAILATHLPDFAERRGVGFSQSRDRQRTAEHGAQRGFEQRAAGGTCHRSGKIVKTPVVHVHPSAARRRTDAA